MGVMPVKKLVLNMSLPMMASMLVQALYNVVDSVFVSRLSENAFTAVSLAFPIQTLMIALCAGTAVGINAFRYKRLSFTFSAVYAGWAGALYAGYMMYVVPTNFALNKSIELITTTVIGGLGSLTGSVLGALLVTLLPEVFRSLSNYRMLIYGFAVVLIIMFRPNGLYGYKEFSLKRLINRLKGGKAKTGKEAA